MPELSKIRKNDVDYDIKDEAARKEIEDLREEVPKIPMNVSAFENDAGYLTEHQDISGKLDADKLPEAVNDALTQAKNSGIFNGEDGYSPVRGTDYWTSADIAEIKSYVDEAILGGAW